MTTARTLEIPEMGPVEVTLDDQGEGRPYLVLHGGAGPQSMAVFAKELAASGDLRVLSPTHPGFGGTQRPDELKSVRDLATLYASLLDELDLQDVTVIGNSVGGWIAAELALRHSPRVADLVLIDAVGIEVEGHHVADVAGLSLPEIQALSFHDPSPFRIDPAQLSDSQKATAGANAAALAVYTGSAAMADPTLRGRLGAIAVPTLVLWGDSDGIVDSEYGRTYASAIPGARFEILADTGHMPQMESPDLVVREILNRS